MFAVMAFFDQFDHNKLYNSAFVLFFFFSESRKFHAMARALPDAIKSAARQISRMLSASIEIILENSRSINFNQRAACEKLGHF